MAPQRKKSDRASRAEVISIHERLKSIIIDLGDGMCAYPDGIDDGTVAADLGVSKTSVLGLRNELFGKLKTYSKSNTPQFEELKALTESLVRCFDTLKDRHNKLVLLLALNKVVDCKHLEVK